MYCRKNNIDFFITFLSVKTGYRTYGVPTVRSDIAAPRTKRISDTKNYGDESDAFGLINPSMYSNKGIYEKDFFQPREPEQVSTNMYKN